MTGIYSKSTPYQYIDSSVPPKRAFVAGYLGFIVGITGLHDFLVKRNQAGVWHLICLMVVVFFIIFPLLNINNIGFSFASIPLIVILTIWSYIESAKILQDAYSAGQSRNPIMNAVYSSTRDATVITALLGLMIGATPTWYYLADLHKNTQLANSIGFGWAYMLVLCIAGLTFIAPIILHIVMAVRTKNIPDKSRRIKLRIINILAPLLELVISVGLAFIIASVVK